MGKTLEECYEVLGLENGASEAEIKSAYRKKALQCHPDKNPDDPLSTQKFQELGHAYRRLTGEEDSDGDDEYDDDDMELWRDFFFFLFREEIMARVRCKCYKCGRAGETEEDDFLASLAKEQEERCQFTEEEMAQFTSFANLKEQREANKKKFCDERNQSSSKPEQKAPKGPHKPKLKSNKQLKMEQWKREKEISEIAAQINQTITKGQEKKAFSKDAKTKEHPQQKSSIQSEVVDKGKVIKEHTEGVSNKRNARKKKNRNKSRQPGDKETDFNQNTSFMKTAVNEQKLPSSFVVQDAVRNVTMKPETTRRQDDVTGRLPRHTRYTSPRMIKANACAQDSTMNSHRNVPQRQTGRGWFENQKPERQQRPSYGANIWQQRQEKQQFLAELQPCNQSDEELQLQMALELSRKQAEIDAQQREITMLEKQMEKTLQMEKQLLQTTDEEESQSATATVTGPDSFPSLGDPVGHEPASSEIEEWGVDSDSEDEWQENEQVSNFSGEYGSDDEDETSERLHKTNDGLSEEHPCQVSTSCGKDNMTAPRANIELPQLSRSQDPHAMDTCPYGKNCCLGRCCMYSHPLSVDNRKRQTSVENDSIFQVQCDRVSSEDADKCNLTCDLTKERTLSVPSCEELASDVSCPGNKNDGQSHHAFSSNVDESIANQSLHSLQPESSASYESESNNCGTTQQSISAGDRVKLDSKTSAGATALSNDLNQGDVTSDNRENLSQSAGNDLNGLDPKSSLEDRSSPIKEKPKINIANDNAGNGNEDGSTVLYQNSTTKEASTAEGNATNPTVYVIADQPQFPFGFPAASALMQSAAALPPLGNLSTGGTNVQNSPHSSSMPLNCTGQMPTALQANLIAQTLGALPQSSGSAVTMPQISASLQNSASPSLGGNLQTPAATPQPNTVVSGTSPQTGAANGFPAVPGFPFLPNVFPFLNPANIAANASLMAAAAAGSIPFPTMPGLSNQQGGGLAMNQPMLPPYLKTDLGAGVSPLGQYLPMQAQLNGMTVGRNVPVPHPPQAQPQSSQTGVSSGPQAATSNVQQPLRLPFPFINPQAFANFNAAIAAGIPYSVLQTGAQTSLQSGLAPSQVQVNGNTTEQCRMKQNTGTGLVKPTDAKRESGEERNGSVSSGGKAPSLRRPATVPKVIQHQASK